MDDNAEQQADDASLPHSSEATPTEDDTPKAHHPQVVSDGVDPSGPLYRAMRITEKHTGPLPSTQYLREINDIIPGGAERIMAMAESNAAHRREMDKSEWNATIDYHKSEQARSFAGLKAGLTVALAFLAGSVGCIVTGHETAGTVIGTVDIVGLVSVFVLSKVTVFPPKDTDAPQPPGGTEEEPSQSSQA